jgi:hypothetical protein
MLLFSVLYGLWVANLVAFNSDVCIDLATEFLSLAEKEGTTGPLMVGHQMLGISLQTSGDITGGRAHYDQAIALYEPVERYLDGRRLYGCWAIPTPPLLTLSTRSRMPARLVTPPV